MGKCLLEQIPETRKTCPHNQAARRGGLAWGMLVEDVRRLNQPHSQETAEEDKRES